MADYRPPASVFNSAITPVEPLKNAIKGAGNAAIQSARWTEALTIIGTTAGQQTIPDDKARLSKAQQLRDEAYGLQRNNRVPEAIAKYRESLQYWPDAQLEQYIKQLEKTVNANPER